MKQFLFKIFALVYMVCIFSFSVSAKERVITVTQNGVKYDCYTAQKIAKVVPDYYKNILGTWSINNDFYRGDIIINNTITYSGVTYKVTEIDVYAFSNSTGVTSVLIPEGVLKIGNYAFNGCTGISSLQLPESLYSIGLDVFGYMSVEQLIIPGIITYCPYSAFEHFSGNVLCRGESYSKLYYAIKDFQNVTLHTFDVKYEFEGYLNGLVFEMKVNDNPYYIQEQGDDSYQFTFYPHTNHPITIDSATTITLDNLALSSDYIASISKINGCDGKTEKVYEVDFQTTHIPRDIKILDTQKSVTYSNKFGKWYGNMNGLNVEEVSFSAMGKTIIVQNEDMCAKEAKFDNLWPGIKVNSSEGECYIIYKYNGGKIYKDKIWFGTKGWDFQGDNLDPSPTTATLNAHYLVDDAIPQSIRWKLDDKVVCDTLLLISGLEPEKHYYAQFEIDYEMPDNTIKTYTFDYSFETCPLQLITLQPRCVSDGCAVISASTNLSDNETRAGFEWKKYDAPTSLTPNSVFSPVCNYKLEGFVNNLQSNFYYNVRAFYKSANGIIVYGDWITFDPSDFSYYDPIVHTFSINKISDTQADLRGYALRGTDSILRQGFQYWCKNNSQTSRASNPFTEIFTIEVDSQVMEITVYNLQSGSEYGVRAFAETTKGLIYGDELSFVTLGNSSNIEEILTKNDHQISIIGYSNANGIISHKPYKGFNIVIYSNGQSKKLFINEQYSLTTTNL